MVKRVIDAVVTAFLVCMALVVISPIFLTVFFSFEDGFSAYADFYVWKPIYLNALFNSVIVALVTSCLSVAVAVAAAYVFAKVKFRGSGILLYLYIIVMLMPFQVTLLPQYIVSKKLGIYDTLLALILPGIFAPFAVFLLTQVMKSIPNEQIEAARLDTGSTFRILISILVPQMKAGIICTWVLVFTEQWNSVAEPLILLETREKYPLAVMLNEGSGEKLLMLAATVVFMILPLLMFAYFENEIMDGLEEYRLK